MGDVEPMFERLVDGLMIGVRAGWRWSIPAKNYPVRRVTGVQVLRVRSSRLSDPSFYFVNPDYHDEMTRHKHAFMKKFTQRAVAEDYAQWVQDRGRPRWWHRVLRLFGYSTRRTASSSGRTTACL